MGSHLRLVSKNPAGSLSPAHSSQQVDTARETLFGTLTGTVTTRSPHKEDASITLPEKSADRVTLGNNLAAEIAATGRSHGLNGGMTHYFAGFITREDVYEPPVAQTLDVIGPMVDTKSLFQKERGGLVYRMYRPIFDSTVGFGLGGGIAVLCGINPILGGLVATGTLYLQNWLAHRKSKRIAQESPRSGFITLIFVDHLPLLGIFRGRYSYWTDNITGQCILNSDHPLTPYIAERWNTKRALASLPAADWTYCLGK